MIFAASAAAFALLAGAAPAAQPPAPKPAAAAALSVDTPITQLLADPRTAAVLEQHMGAFVKRLQTDEEFARYFDGSTLRDLTIDVHVKGFDETKLAMMQRELSAAQAPTP